MSTNPIVDKLRKLIAHEKSCRAIGSISEAEAFASKIQQLLDEHKLGMDEVAFEEREAGEPIGWTHVGSEDEAEGFRYKRRREKWQVRLANAVADCNTCEMILSDGNSVCFVGRTSDREICKAIFLYFIDLAYRLNDTCAKEEKDEQKLKYQNTLDEWQDFSLPAFRLWMKGFRKEWFRGFALAVTRRMYVQAEAMKAAVAANETAMVHLSRDLVLIKQETEGKTKSTPVYNRSQARNDDGFRKGFVTGHSVNLSPNRFANTAGRASRLLGS